MSKRRLGQYVSTLFMSVTEIIISQKYQSFEIDENTQHSNVKMKNL